MTATRTTCAYCGVGCGVIASTGADGKVEIAGDAQHPANFGRLCTKGQTLGETLSPEGRLLYPTVGGKRSDWDSATSLVAEKFRAAIAEHGPDSVAFYVSGQFLTEDYYVANKLMKGYIGSANIDTNSRLCMASSVAGHKRAFGTDTVPGTYEDLDEADLIVLVGSNLAWCHPVLHQRIMAAKQDRGTRIINIDPRRTATSDMADVHLGIRPGGDVALFNHLLAEIVRQDAVDLDYVASHVTGFEAAASNALKAEIDEVVAKTGLTPGQLAQFAGAFIATKRVVTIYSQGVNQASDGTDKVNAIINCHLATGRIGQPGCGPFSVTGQPNAMGGREVGGLANMLAGHLDIEDAGHREMVQAFWDSPTVPTEAGLKAVDLFDACAEGRIKALWIMCTNPAVSLPRADHVAEAIRKVDFVAVSDIIADTDTNKLADVLLPATGWGEKDGTVTNSERRISRQRAFLPAPGEARPDWQALCDVAAKMGWKEAFDYNSANEIFAEYAAMTGLAVEAGRDLDLTALANLTAADYDALEPVQWPVRPDRADSRFFADGGFFTSDGKARMLPVAHRQSPNRTSEDYPLVLNTGRVRDHWHTMTRSARSVTLSQHIAEPFAEIHPEDALAQGIKPAGLVRVVSPHGAVVVRAQITERAPKGHVFVPLHWTGQFSSRGRVDAVVAPVCDPVSGQPELKRTAVRIEPFRAGFYGFGVSRTEPKPSCAYWAKARTGNGWRIELAERGAPLDFEAFARASLGVSGGEAVTYTDAASGQSRIAFVEDGRVIACLFAGPEPVFASRSFVSAALGGEDYGNLLAGIGGAGCVDAGPVVCNCFNVGLNAIVGQIQSGTAMSLDDLGKSLQAGTNCGSCRPELTALLNKHAPRLAAE